MPMPAETTPATPLGARLRAARKARGESQTAVAELTGVAQPVISDIETGAVRAPGFETVARLARHYGIPVDDLLDEAS